MSKKKKNKYQKVARVFKVLSIIGIILWISLFTFNYMIGGEDDEVVSADGTISTAGKKDVINALVCGVNDHLTDTMIYVRYDVKSRKNCYDVYSKRYIYY